MPLNPWVLAGGLMAAIVIFFAGYGKGHHDAKVSWELASVKLEADAANKLSEANEKAALKDAAMASLSRNLDEQHAKYIADQESTRGDFERELTRRVRESERRASRGCQLPSPSIGAGEPTDSAAGSLNQLSGIDVESLQAIADNANKLAATVLTCVDWAAEVGR